MIKVADRLWLKGNYHSQEMFIVTGPGRYAPGSVFVWR